MQLIKSNQRMTSGYPYNILQDGRKVGELYRFWMSGDAFTDGRYLWQVVIEGDSRNSESFKTFKEAKKFVEGLG